MYDLIIIGAGWAGFNAAQRAKEMGMKVALVEKDLVGGTCLNRGCIPTKTLIQSARVYALATGAGNFGINISSKPAVDFSVIQSRKEKIIQILRKGMEYGLRDVDMYQGAGKIIDAETIEVSGSQLKTRFILITCGSEPKTLKGLEFDGKKILTSNDLLSIKKVPSSLLIVGGGVIGCEFASLFSLLGSEVSIAELMPQLLPGIDTEVARKIETVFKKRGIKVSTATDAETLDVSSYEAVLVCVGRKPALNGIDLEGAGVRVENNRIAVDDYLRTDIPGIYAAGDCASEVMLAHFAAYQGRLAVENMVDQNNAKGVSLSTGKIVNCVFTDPEIGSVGLNEDQARKKGLAVKVNKFDFLGSGMARILDATDGFIKIVSDTKTGEILGADIIGPKATELIGILAMAVQCRLKTAQVKSIIFAHPTLSESIGDVLRRG